MIKFVPDITIKYLLTKVSEEEIFERYGNGLKVQTGVFRSTLRSDRRPTCRFYRNRNGKLILHDLAGHFHGDCFDMVMKTRRLTFDQALRDVAISFGILAGETRKPVSSPITIGPKSICEIRIRSMKWDQQHYMYWKEHGVSINTLNELDIVPVEQVWLNGYIFYNRDYTRKTEVVFAYRFGGFDYKIYFPLRTRDKIRFLHNNPDVLQGYKQLPETGEIVVITKSMKDIACLREFGIPALGPMSETSVVSNHVLEDLFSRFTYVFALYDRDRTGCIGLLNLRSRGVSPLLMPLGMGKDFADLCKKNIHQARELVEQFKARFI